MAEPVLTPAGEAVYDRLAPWAVHDPESGYGVAWIAYGLGIVLGEVYDFAQLGWDEADDPDLAPEWYLPHLAMKAGVRLLPEGLTLEQKRIRVRSTDGLRRGTVDAIRGAAQVHLTGDRDVVVLERSDPANPGDEPYHLTVITYTSQTPDSAAVEAALLEQKPVGLILHYLVVAGWTVGEFETAYDGSTVGDIEGDFATVYDLETNEP